MVLLYVEALLCLHGSSKCIMQSCEWQYRREAEKWYHPNKLCNHCLDYTCLIDSVLRYLSPFLLVSTVPVLGGGCTLKECDTGTISTIIFHLSNHIGEFKFCTFFLLWIRYTVYCLIYWDMVILHFALCTVFVHLHFIYPYDIWSCVNISIMSHHVL